MPSAPLRRTLRSAGHSLDPVVQIGKQGVTDPVVAQVSRALLDHELIKIKLGTECPSDRFEVADRLSGEPGVQVAQILGRTILLYKRHAKVPKFEESKKSAKAKAAPKRRLAPKRSAPKRALAPKSAPRGRAAPMKRTASRARRP
jgi:RNA-binding protein